MHGDYFGLDALKRALLTKDEQIFKTIPMKDLIFSLREELL